MDSGFSPQGIQLDEQSLFMLRSVEAVFVEFNLATTSNLRKREIEAQLKTVLSDPKNWRFWIDAVGVSQNQFLIMHCLNLLNDFISNFWITWASIDQKTYVKDRLLLYLTTKSFSFPSFVMTKIVKLVVDIARNDWPHFYPAFFANVEELVGNPSLGLLGLKMLRLVCEEFIHPKEDLRYTRREELRELLNEKVPAILTMLEKSLLPVVEAVQARNSSGMSSVPPESMRNCLEALQVFGQVITWSPANIALPSSLLQALFCFANCDPENSQLYELATFSLNDISDLVGKNSATAEMERNLWMVYEFAFVRLETINRYLQDKEDVSDSFSEYLQQFIELLRPLLVSHLQRFEAHQNFPTMNFLERFFAFTFRIPAFDLFLSCIDIWNDFLDRILAVSSARASSTKATILQSYSAPILALVDSLLGRIQMHFNESQLEELDEKSTTGEEGVSERVDYFQRCIGVMIKAGEIMPKPVLDKFTARYSELKGMLLQIRGVVQTGVTDGHESAVLPITDQQTIKQLHFILRDLSIVSQAAASHCGLLTGDLYPLYTQPALAFLHSLLEILTFLTDTLRSLRHFRAHDPLPTDFAHLHVSLYTALESVFPWLTQYYTANPNANLIMAIAKACLSPVFHGAEPNICQSGTKALKSLTKLIRIQGVDKWDVVENLFRVDVWSLAESVRVNVICVMSNVVALPVGGLTLEQQGWDERAEKHAKIMGKVVERYCRIPADAAPTPQVLEIVRSTLDLLNGLLLSTADDAKKTKQIVLNSITPLLQTTANLLPAFQKVPEERSAVLRFVLTVFSSLKSAFPSELTSPLSDLFEGLFEQFLDPDELLRTFRSTDPVQIESLSTCFDLLKLVVSDPTYKSYLPFVIALCHIVCPALETTPDIRIEFRQASYELLLSVLTQHWTYFFKSSRLIESTNGNGFDVSLQDEKTEAKDFLVIVHCLGGALVQPEISLAQLVLKGLLQLHSSRQIFDKVPFREALRGSFLQVLLGMLVNKDKQLLVDEVYSMVFQVAFSGGDAGVWFYESFLSEVLEKWPGLSGEQAKILHQEFDLESDLVGFTEQLQVLVTELRCYLMYNSVRT